MQADLQPYLLREDEPAPLLVIDPVGITDEQQESACFQLMALGSRRNETIPLGRFTGNRVQLIPSPKFQAMHYCIFDSDEVDRNVVIQEHMNCQFIADDVYAFEQAYGLGAESIHPRQNDEMCGEGTLEEPPMLPRVSSQGEGGPKAAIGEKCSEDEDTTGSSFAQEAARLYAAQVTAQWTDGDPAESRLSIGQVWQKLLFDPFYGRSGTGDVTAINNDIKARILSGINPVPQWMRGCPQQEFVHLLVARWGLHIYKPEEDKPFRWRKGGKAYRDHSQLEDCEIERDEFRDLLDTHGLPRPQFWFPQESRDPLSDAALIGNTTAPDTKPTKATMPKEQRLWAVAIPRAHMIFDREQEKGRTLTAEELANHPTFVALWKGRKLPKHSYRVKKIYGMGLPLKKGAPFKQ